MNVAKTARVSEIAGRVKEIWGELDYAQARLLEIRTGVPGLTRRGRPWRAPRVREAGSRPPPAGEAPGA